MTMRDIDDVIARVLTGVLKRAVAVGEDVQQEEEPDWDSLRHIEIAFAIEGALGIQFDEEELSDIRSSGDIKRFAELKLAS
jgi:acyl carrier protein